MGTLAITKTTLVSIPVDALPESPNPALGQHLASIVDCIVPSRPDDDSWMLVFTQDDKVLDSFSGGKIDIISTTHD